MHMCPCYPVVSHFTLKYGSIIYRNFLYWYFTGVLPVFWITYCVLGLKEISINLTENTGRIWLVSFPFFHRFLLQCYNSCHIYIKQHTVFILELGMFCVAVLTKSLCSCSLVTLLRSWAFLRLRASIRASHWATKHASNSTPFSWNKVRKELDSKSWYSTSQVCVRVHKC